MRTMNQSLFDLYRAGVVSYEDAVDHTSDVGEFQRLMERAAVGDGAGGASARRLKR
jgi:Tfp pilus assembly ATPase PilU